jgi:hypothetical protein
MPFFLLKGLSFLPFGGFLKNPKVIMGIILIAVLAFAYVKWKSAIKKAVFNQIYTEQAEQHIANQQRELERQRALMLESQRATDAAKKRRDAILKDIEAARAKTRNVDPKNDGAIAPVLSDALDFIRARQTSPEPPKRTLGEKVGDVVDGGTKALKDAQGAAEETGNKFIDEWKERMNR